MLRWSSSRLRFLFIALRLGLDQRPQTHNGVVERVGELPDLVARLHGHQPRQVACPTRSATLTTWMTGLVIWWAKTAPARTASNATPPKTSSRFWPEPGRRGGDDRPVHADANRPELAREDRHADVDDLLDRPGDRIRVAISRTCCPASPGTRLRSTMPAGTSGENVWATSVFCGSYTITYLTPLIAANWSTVA